MVAEKKLLTVKKRKLRSEYIEGAGFKDRRRG
jgi:hypothetical protein